MSFSQLLPKPKNLNASKWSSLQSDSEDEVDVKAAANRKAKAAAASPVVEGLKNNILIPAYGKRKGWTPISQSDFGNGGAYPEIHINQYPLGLGHKDNLNSSSSTLALQTDASTGKLKYDVVLHSQASSKKIIHSSLNDMKQQDTTKELDLKPDEEELAAIAEKTRAALEGIVDKKVKANKNRALSKDAGGAGPVFVKYTPSETKDTSSAAADSRIIRISEVPIDPFEPSRFKHRKIPRAGGSPPPPVLRSPPRKVSEEEQKNWVIPPCISNWKNAKGYTIPLDKRLANDGRGMQDVTINDNFSKLSEALFIADRHAREEVKLRSELATKVLQKEKMEKEEKLRQLAQKARMERGGAATSENAPTAAQDQESGSSESESESEEEEEKMTALERKQLRERQELRKEKARQRERELRKAANANRKDGAAKGDRDISEKIALGISQPTVSKDSMFDQRLFNQTSGIASGYGGASEDAYSIYDKPLFNSAVSNIYKPTAAGGGDIEGGVEGVDVGQFEGMLASKTAPHRGFSGTEGGAAAGGSGPVQFEKEKDVFGVDAFMSAAKRATAGDDGDKEVKKARR